MACLLCFLSSSPVCARQFTTKSDWFKLNPLHVVIMGLDASSAGQSLIRGDVIVIKMESLRSELSCRPRVLRVALEHIAQKVLCLRDDFC